jgi:phage shock protein C
VERLFRSRNNSMIGGVCGGLSEYLKIDPTIIRLGFVILGLYSNIGIAAYLILWVIMPYPDKSETPVSEILREGAEEIKSKAQETIKTIGSSSGCSQSPTANTIIGVLFVGLGILFLARTLNITWLRRFNSRALLPIAIIIIGLMLLRRHRTNGGNE